MNAMRFWKTAVFLLLLAHGPQLWAHARMVRSDPAARAILNRAPAQIQLWFNEKLEPAYSAVELRDDKGTVIPTEKSQVSPTDARLIVLKAPALQDGRYIVKYRVLSLDGHVVQAEFRFTIRSARQ